MNHPYPKNDLPLVTVIVPTRNSGRTIETCLESIVKQTYANIDLIVVDNNSNDETKDIARKYTSSVHNHGPERNYQRSYAANMANGKYLVFIDSDMQLSPALIESSVRMCETYGYDAIVLPEISAGEGFWANCRKLEVYSILNDEFRELANRFIRREAYFAVGGYEVNLDWIGGEDYDIHERIKTSGYKIGRTDQVILHHEIVPFWAMLRKYRIYGNYLAKHVRKHPGTGFRQFVMPPSGYLKNWKLFARNPIHTAGLIFLKVSLYLAATTGLLTSIPHYVKRRYSD